MPSPKEQDVRRRLDEDIPSMHGLSALRRGAARPDPAIRVGFVLGSRELYEAMRENPEFAVLPQEAPATLFGTNKIASIFGTLSAARRYVRAVEMPWKLVLPAAATASRTAGRAPRRRGRARRSLPDRERSPGLGRVGGLRQNPAPARPLRLSRRLRPLPGAARPGRRALAREVRKPLNQQAVAVLVYLALFASLAGELGSQLVPVEIPYTV